MWRLPGWVCRVTKEAATNVIAQAVACHRRQCFQQKLLHFRVLGNIKVRKQRVKLRIRWEFRLFPKAIGNGVARVHGNDCKLFDKRGSNAGLFEGYHR